MQAGVTDHGGNLFSVQPAFTLNPDAQYFVRSRRPRCRGSAVQTSNSSFNTNPVLQIDASSLVPRMAPRSDARPLRSTSRS